ncbi:HAMP domain-containing histidine kinase [Plantibacter sp. VKM Ac-2885]|uniref:sensor histidine kinase n=1 Tax=unclassified Plantibacter TaxID=2624265 RepID=UPI001785BDE7|nr:MULTISPECIES: HAMP domain-containing sensor histidine kinase [unclassified Plantibacter]MBD8516745.1 HAMP domain-containing histidine kinase [Plantibacter sp. CFBP 8804]MBF4514546.1 HAMP domain-containing histidine kinase [Plantibacter sp. VKM Ac-2885]
MPAKPIGERTPPSGPSASGDTASAPGLADTGPTRTGPHAVEVPRRVGRMTGYSAFPQLLFGLAVVAILFATLLFQGVDDNSVLFYIGVILAFIATALAPIVPWHQVPRLLIALPILDIIAIALIRQGEPLIGAGLLWVFPTIWMATAFGLAGAITAIVLVCTSSWSTLAMTPGQITIANLPALVILPTVLAFVAVSTAMTAKRTEAQRVLLNKQAGQLETALGRAQDQESRLAEILNAVNFGVVRFDRIGARAMVNRFQTRLQDEVGELSDVNPALPVWAEDGLTLLQPQDKPYIRARRGEEFENLTVWLGAPGTERIALALTSRRLYDHEGGYDGTVLVSRNVTSEINAIRARDDLVASVSHELRTPLTSILGYLDLALDDPGLPPRVAKQLTIAQTNGDRLLELIADILAASRDVNRTMVLERSECELREIVDRSVESLAHVAAERSITIVRHDEEAVPLFADPFRLRQVVDNLLSNGIKYNRDGGELSVGVTAEGDTAWVIVRDTGIGISEEDQPKLFERFFRSDLVRNSTVHGSGLGLAISRDIVRLHGGDLTVHSVLGEGTTAVVRIPRGGTE